MSKPPPGKQRPRRLARIDVDHFVADLLERLAQHEADRGLVVRDQDARLRFRHAALLSGSSTRTRVPWPVRLSTWSAPPCSVTKWRASARPSPVPRALVVKNGVAMRSRTASGMPQPLSSKSTATLGDALAVAEVDAVVEAQMGADGERALAARPSPRARCGRGSGTPASADRRRRGTRGSTDRSGARPCRARRADRRRADRARRRARGAGSPARGGSRRRGRRRGSRRAARRCGRPRARSARRRRDRGRSRRASPAARPRRGFRRGDCAPRGRSPTRSARAPRRRRARARLRAAPRRASGRAARHGAVDRAAIVGQRRDGGVDQQVALEAARHADLVLDAGVAVGQHRAHRLGEAARADHLLDRAAPRPPPSRSRGSGRLRRSGVRRGPPHRRPPRRRGAHRAHGGGRRPSDCLGFGHPSRGPRVRRPERPPVPAPARPEIARRSASLRRSRPGDRHGPTRSTAPGAPPVRALALQREGALGPRLEGDRASPRDLPAGTARAADPAPLGAERDARTVSRRRRRSRARRRSSTRSKRGFPARPLYPRIPRCASARSRSSATSTPKSASLRAPRCSRCCSRSPTTCARPSRGHRARAARTRAIARRCPR